jgi:hypothetical protein
MYLITVNWSLYTRHLYPLVGCYLYEMSEIVANSQIITIQIAIPITNYYPNGLSAAF